MKNKTKKILAGACLGLVGMGCLAGCDKKQDYYELTVINDSQYGIISPILDNETNSVTVDRGDDYTFTITPREGYEIKNLLIDGQLVDAQTIYTFNDVESDHSIGAVYSRKINSLKVIGIEFDAYYEDGFDGERTTEEIKFGIAQIDYYDSSTNGFKDIFTFVNRFVPGDGSVSGHCSYGQLSGVTYHHDIEFSQDGKYGQLSLMAYLSDSMNYGTACALFINLDELNSEDNYHDDVYRLPVHLFSENVVINAESANNVVISNLELICEANY